MNLHEALKTGKNIRRTGRSTWSAPHGNSYITDPLQGHWMAPDFYLDRVGVDKEDLLAEDWEVQEKEVKITRTLFLTALHKAMVDQSGKRILTWSDDLLIEQALSRTIIPQLIQYLGLEGED